MEKYLECLTGDLYPTGQQRLEIMEHRLTHRDNYRKVDPITFETWTLELHEGKEIKVGDYVSINNAKPFEIKEILVKHISLNSYKTTFVGEKKSLNFECYGTVPVSFYK
jgi:hypothetical protein